MPLHLLLRRAWSPRTLVDVVRPPHIRPTKTLFFLSRPKIQQNGRCLSSSWCDSDRAAVELSSAIYKLASGVLVATESWMEGKRLDLDAPLISFRRITTASLLPEDAELQSLRQALLNGRVKGSGAVPFFWEKTPGQPREYLSNESFCSGATIRCKEPQKPLLGRILKGSGGELLKNESSVTEKSLGSNESLSTKKRAPSLCGNPYFRDYSSNFSKDPKTKEFMLGLYLPAAAEPMASGSPRQSWKKPSRAQPEFAKDSGIQDVWVNAASTLDNDWNEKEEEEDDEREYEDKKYFSSKTCGLFPKFSLKNSFCFLNSVFGMKFADLNSTGPCLKPTPGMKILHHERVSKNLLGSGFRHRSANEDYIEHDNGIDLTSIFNQLIYYSNSQPLPHTSDTALLPNKNEDLKTKSKSSKTCDFDSSEDGESYWEVASSSCWLQGSGSTSPATKCMQPSQMPDTSVSNSSTVNMTTFTKETIDSTPNDYTEPGFSFCTRRLNCDEKVSTDSRNCKSNPEDLELIRDCPKDENSLASSLLPPLPKSPSDSWLQRTLPGIAAKGPYERSFLGMQSCSASI